MGGDGEDGVDGEGLLVVFLGVVEGECVVVVVGDGVGDDYFDVEFG